ncbi:MAG TPA: C69 family dipeptidase [Acidobacteriota bacterium]|nr:C69 family dipeptidase [Acidobacteriota bacterium]
MKNPRMLPLRRLTVFASFLFLIALSSISARAPQAGYPDPDSCTSIMVGRLASKDGSVITCHTCDGNYRTWLNIVPHQKHEKGSTSKIYWGTLHTESPTDTTGKILKGEISQVEETYSYLNTAYPCLNEKQLAIGETTIGGRQQLYNDEGWFLIEELERIALERCKTARDAIRLIGELVKKNGYGDYGECITLADPKEVWQLEIFGAGPAQAGSVWAAARVPDDHVGVSANIPRINEINLQDPDHCMASDNVFSLAEEMGWWKKGEPFKFWRAYSGRKPFSDREFYILSTLAPSLNLQSDAEELPFSVKPSRQLSVEDVMKYYRETYEGTDFDMTKTLMTPKRRQMQRGQKAPADEKPGELVKSPVASGWMGDDLITLLNTLKPGTVERRRTIAIAACSYSQIIQCRGWLPAEIGGVAWFSFDNPGESPRIPIFAGVLALPKSFEIGSQQGYQPESASWAFRRTNRLAAIKWGASRKQIEDAVAEFQEKALVELPAVEKIALQYYNADDAETGRTKARQYLTKYTNDFARAAINKWSELEGTFWAMYARGF